MREDGRSCVMRLASILFCSIRNCEKNPTASTELCKIAKWLEVEAAIGRFLRKEGVCGYDAHHAAARR